MKAIVYTEYGPPDVLQLIEVEKPTPKEDEVLVEVQASSVNPRDWHLMRADPFPVRLMVGFLKPKDTQIGSDMAGRVEAVGRNVKQFKPGDEVFGDIGESGGGAFAEYVSVPVNAVVLKPDSMTFEEAAAVPAGALAALQGLRDQGQIQPGNKVLINGASGGVGTFAVQIAKSFGADVTGVCSTRNLDMVRALGADQVIDYTQEDVTQNGQRYDLIIDNVGNPSVYKRLYKRSLSPNGICVIAAGSFFLQLFLGPWMSMTGSNKIGTYLTMPNQSDLAFIKELLEAGEVVPVIDRRYLLSEVAEAIRYLEEGHAQGKVVITVKHNSK
ncbi:MAG: zinc-binding dehydrogenase [Chloroflexi bacterium]|jgi:NADPH:quinone reductase-like Zn-dependent oxidoreductase|nr:zinc-binding dehydrogenase [Chloroflexota bacterium]